jgi:hypothetical protein
MGYRNKTYVIFDGDKDMGIRLYARLEQERKHGIQLYNAHDLRPMEGTASEAYVKSVLKQRLQNTKQAIVIVGDSTRYLYKFVRWEIETCIEMGIPIVVVNLNGLKAMDTELCPPILRGTCTIHVPFKAKAIQFALDDFCDGFANYKTQGFTDLYLKPHVYTSLGL